jgi:hypothetical protein
MVHPATLPLPYSFNSPPTLGPYSLPMINQTALNPSAAGVVFQPSFQDQTGLVFSPPQLIQPLQSHNNPSGLNMGNAIEGK